MQRQSTSDFLVDTNELLAVDTGPSTAIDETVDIDWDRYTEMTHEELRRIQLVANLIPYLQKSPTITKSHTVYDIITDLLGLVHDPSIEPVTIDYSPEAFMKALSRLHRLRADCVNLIKVSDRRRGIQHKTKHRSDNK